MFQDITIVGNLGQDPEMRFLPSGKAVVNFSVATNRKWTGQDGEVHEEVIWWRISAFGRMAEVCNEYLSKGRSVLIKGRLRPDPETGGPRVYQKRDGSYGASYELNASTVKFLGGRSDSGPPGPGGEPAAPADVEPDPIPF